MRLLKLLHSRMAMTGAIVLVQLFYFIYFIYKLTEYQQWVSNFLLVMSLLIVLYIVKKNENSSYRLAWVILILVVPIFGGLFYLVFGNKRPSMNLRKKLDVEHQKVLTMFECIDCDIPLRQNTDRFYGLTKYLEDYSGYPVFANDDVTYYKIGEEIFSDMLASIKEAQQYIFLEYFIYSDGLMWQELFEALRDRAAQGVEVFLIYDDVGSMSLLPKNFKQSLRHAGIECLAFNPFRPILSLAVNNRDHRKMLVVDGHTAYSGGINIADEYINELERFGHWKDTGIRVRGNGVVSFNMMFLEMWNAFHPRKLAYEDYFSTNDYEPSKSYIQPFTDTPLDNEAVSQNVYMDILNQATDYVYIFTPYLIIDDEMKTALTLASKRGVDVKIITPGIPDKKIVFRLTRANYVHLIEDGVEIYEYTPGFLHAKSYVSDDNLAVIGTINMDYRSLYLHFECGVLVKNAPMILDLRNDVLESLKVCRKIELQDLRTGVIGALFDSLLQLLAPLM